MNERLVLDQPEPVALAPSRRDFLRGIRSATVGALLLSLNEHDREPSEIEKLLLGIEAGVDGAQKPEVIRSPSASRIFIHVGQNHIRPKMIPSDQFIVKQSQADVERILRDLSNRGMRDIFLEGITSESLREWGPEGRILDIASIRQLLDSTSRELTDLEQAKQTDAREIAWRREYIKSETARVREMEAMTDEQWRERVLMPLFRQRAEWHAADRLALEGKAHIHAAETEEANDVAFRMPLDDPRYDQVVKQNRENVAIDLFDTSGLPVGICVYGGAHNFRDNIEIHNRAHPSGKMHLVVLTPLFHRQIRKSKQ